MNKKGIVPTITITATAIILVVLFLFAGVGTIKFLFMDKTPLIIGGILVILFLIGQKKRGGF